MVQRWTEWEMFSKLLSLEDQSKPIFNALFITFIDWLNYFLRESKQLGQLT